MPRSVRQRVLQSGGRAEGPQVDCKIRLIVIARSHSEVEWNTHGKLEKNDRELRE